MKKFFYSIIFLFVLGTLDFSLFAQKSTQIRSILTKFESYRYSNIYVFKLNEQTKSDLIPLLSSAKPTEPSEKRGFTIKDKEAVIEASKLQDFNKNDSKVLKDLGIAKWTKNHADYLNYLDSLSNWQSSVFSSAYVITNRFVQGDTPILIALITSNSKMSDDVNSALGPTEKTSGYKTVYLPNPDLEGKPSPRKDETKTNDLAEYLVWRIKQDDVENVTAEVQGIDGNTKFLPQKYGTSYSINEDDIQMYLRISEGQPQEYEHPYELTVGLFDVVRFRRYGKLEDPASPSNTGDIGTSALDDNSKVSAGQNPAGQNPAGQNPAGQNPAGQNPAGQNPAGQNPAGQNSTGSISKNSDSLNQVNPVIPVATTQEQSVEAPKKVYNRDLPLYGVELKYGLPEINYPSLWSERMTLSVMWQSNKFGIVLPTNGWSSLATDVFSAKRKLTHAGLGIYGSLDFPIKLLNQGGVFNFNGSYVFGDAAVNPIATEFMFAGRNASGQSDSASYRSVDLSYLPRFHAQAHYSFAVDIDRTAFFRFKLGATMYVIQRFAELEQQNGNDENGRPIYEKKNRQIDQYSYDDLSTLNRFDQLKIAGINGLQASEVIAGLSGRIEFMNRSRTVPWGASMQFFDGCISGDVWAQVPVTNQFNIRLQAQYFQAALRDPKPWELQTIVLPSLQMIFNF